MFEKEGKNQLPITPLHVVYAWPIKMYYRNLSFSALTIGSMIPDVENLVFFLLGIYPNRLVTHSLIGAFTADLILTIAACYILHRLRVERIGIHGFETFKLNAGFALSAIIGALSHVLIDYVHHEFNPVLWPFGPRYITGPLVYTLGPLGAHLLAQAISLAILLYLLRMTLKSNGEKLWVLLSDPRRSLEVVTRILSSS